MNRLRLFGPALPMPTDRLPRHMPYSEAGRGSQCMTWQEGIKTVTDGLFPLGPVRLVSDC